MRSDATAPEHLSREDAILAWHFLPEDDRLANRGSKVKVEAGETYSVEPPILPCEHGLHGSIKILDALKYAPGPYVCRTQHWGEVAHHNGDKLASQHRRALWIADASRVLHEFACDLAEDALNLVASNGGAIDPRSRAAIEVKRRWLGGEATDRELAAARADARSAAWDAALAADAWDAALVSAWACSWARSWVSARVAARASRASALITSRNALNTKLESAISALEPKGVTP